MTAPTVGDWTTIQFRKSSRSSTNGGQCVEVGARPGLIAVRDSKCPEGGLVVLPDVAWGRFLSAVRR